MPYRLKDNIVDVKVAVAFLAVVRSGAMFGGVGGLAIRTVKVNPFFVNHKTFVLIGLLADAGSNQVPAPISVYP